MTVIVVNCAYNGVCGPIVRMLILNVETESYFRSDLSLNTAHDHRQIVRTC